MGRPKEVADQRPNPEQLLIDAEEAAAAEAAAPAIAERAASLKDECRKPSAKEKGQLAAFLMDKGVRGRGWGSMHSSEVAALLGHTKEWVRVYKHFARREFPCGGGPTSCGGDQPACAHTRGRKIFYRALLKALNTHESKPRTGIDGLPKSS
jgi:hypothetical protein